MNSLSIEELPNSLFHSTYRASSRGCSRGSDIILPFKLVTLLLKKKLYVWGSKSQTLSNHSVILYWYSRHHDHDCQIWTRRSLVFVICNYEEESELPSKAGMIIHNTFVSIMIIVQNSSFLSRKMKPRKSSNITYEASWQDGDYQRDARFVHASLFPRSKLFKINLSKRNKKVYEPS